MKRLLLALALAAPLSAQDTTVTTTRCVTVGSSRVCTATETIARAAVAPPVVSPPVVSQPPVVSPPVVSEPTNPGSHEPAGLAKIAENPMSCYQSCGNGWYWGQGYSGAIQIVNDAQAPRSASGVVQQNFTPTLPGGSSPAWVGTGITPVTTIYLSYWMKLSANYVGHPTNVNKTWFVYLSDRNMVIPMVRGAGLNALHAGLNLQGLGGAYTFVESGRTITGSTEANLYPNDKPCTVNRGQWHHYEYTFVANTPGQRNGTAEWWLDGQHCATYTGIMYAASGWGSKWNQINWSPIWGGGLAKNSTTFYAQMDHAYVSGK